MQLVTFSEAVTITFKRSTGTFECRFPSNQPTVFTNEQFRKAAEHHKQLFSRVSELEPRLKNFSITNKSDRNRLLFWNGSGGYGDQMMSWPVARVLSQLGFEVSVLTDPGQQECWYAMDWVKGIYTLPCPLSLLNLFDHCCFFETVVNHDDHCDQKHPVDTMLHKIGLDPASFVSTRKVYTPTFTPLERQCADDYIRQFNRPVGIYQLAASGSSRSLSPSSSAELFGTLAETLPELHWIGVYDTFVPLEYKLKAELVKQPNATVAFFANLRVLWALAQRAKLVVAPDSMLVHAAGSFGTPCVSIWGPTDPATRLKYYPRQLSAWYPERCEKAPCYQSSEPPKACGSHCRVLTSIDTREVIQKAKLLLYGKSA